MNDNYEYDRFTVDRLMKELRPLETIKSGEPIKKALEKMCVKEYSQLPVIDGRNCIGAVTLDSISRRLPRIFQKGKQGLDFMDWPVKGFVDENIRYASVDDDIIKYVEWMAEKGFILVGVPSNPRAIITNYDLALFLFPKKSNCCNYRYD